MTPIRAHALLIGCLALLAAPVPAGASVSVSPTRVELQAKPRQVRAGFFTVQNKGETPLEVSVEPEDWEGGIGGARGPVPWLTVHPTQLRLAPGKSTRVKYTIRVPGDAHGELRTQMFFTTAVASGEMPTRSRLGVIIYVEIEGTVETRGEITGFSALYSASTPGVPRPDELQLVVRIHNLGNAHIRPYGTVKVRNEQGHAVAELSIPRGWALLPNEEDAYHAVGQAYLQPGRYRFEVVVALGGDVRRPIIVERVVDALVTPEGAVQLHAPGPPPAS